MKNKFRRFLSIILSSVMVASSASFTYGEETVSQTDPEIAIDATPMAEVVTSGTTLNVPEGDISAFSLLPLDEINVTVDLSKLYSVELRSMKVADILAMAEDSNGNPVSVDPNAVTVWDKCPDENGSIQDNVWKKLGMQDTLNLKDSAYETFVVIVGSGNQLDINNQRYIIKFTNRAKAIDLEILDPDDLTKDMRISPGFGIYDKEDDPLDGVDTISIFANKKYALNADYILKGTVDEIEGAKLSMYKGRYATAQEAKANSAMDISSVLQEDGCSGKWLSSAANDTKEWITIICERDGKTTGIISYLIDISLNEAFLYNYIIHFSETDASGKQSPIGDYRSYDVIPNDEEETGSTTEYVDKTIFINNVSAFYNASETYSLSMELNEDYEDVDVKIYEGAYTSAQEAEEVASKLPSIDITDSITGEAGYQARFLSEQRIDKKTFTAVYRNKGEIVHTESFEIVFDHNPCILANSMDVSMYDAKNDEVLLCKSTKLATEKYGNITDDEVKFDEGDVRYVSTYSLTLPADRNKNESFCMKTSKVTPPEGVEMKAFLGDYITLNSALQAYNANNSIDITTALTTTGYNAQWAAHPFSSVTLVYYRNGKAVAFENVRVEISFESLNYSTAVYAQDGSLVGDTNSSDLKLELDPEKNKLTDNYRLLIKCTDNSGKDASSKVIKAVRGKYDTLEDVADLPDIKASLFADSYANGYSFNFAQEGIAITLFTENGSKVITLTASEEEEEAKKEMPPYLDPGSPDRYFRVEGLYSGNEKLDTYILPHQHDTNYYYGYQTIFIKEAEGQEVDLSKITPWVYLSNDASLFSHSNSSEKIELRDTPDFFETTQEESTQVNTEETVETTTRINSSSSGKTEGYIPPQDFTKDSSDATSPSNSVTYAVAASNHVNTRNYWITVVKNVEGPKLFVNGPDRRDIFFNNGDLNVHDIFIANIGSEPLKGINVELLDANNLQLSDYWTIGLNGNNELAPFTKTHEDGKDGKKDEGYLPNIGKIRLQATGNEVSGTVKISADGQEDRYITISGEAISPKITTTEIADAVKYVHYYAMITTDCKYDWIQPEFKLVEGKGKLPEGVQVHSSGEISGVPKETGTFNFTVEVEYGDGFETETADFTLKVNDNTDKNVNAQVDDIHKIDIPIPDFVVDEDRILEIQGELDDFVSVCIDGVELVRGVDYIAEKGSAKLTINAKTFADKGDGKHTISAEFREGRNKSKPLTKAAQNYRRGTNDGSTDLGSGSGGTDDSSGGGSDTPGSNPTPGGNTTGGSNSGGRSNSNRFTVSYVSNGGSAVTSQSVSKGQSISFLATPARPGYRFVGWYTDEELTTAFDKSSKINASITLYAKWEQVDCTVWFDAKGGSQVSSVELKGDTALEQLPVTTRDGYSFVGWFTPEGTEFKAGDKVYENLTLEARWEIIIPDAPPTEASGFYDVDARAWYYNDVQWAYENGIMVGYNNALFAPSASLKVSNIVTVLAKLSGDDLSQYTADGNAWYTAYMQWAADKGIIDSSVYTPDYVVTREEIADILTKYISVMGLELETSDAAVSFADSALIAADKAEAVEALCRMGILAGRPDNTIAPKSHTTRAEFAALIHRIYD